MIHFLDLRVATWRVSKRQANRVRWIWADKRDTFGVKRIGKDKINSVINAFNVRSYGKLMKFVVANNRNATGSGDSGGPAIFKKKITGISHSSLYKGGPNGDIKPDHGES